MAASFIAKTGPLPPFLIKELGFVVRVHNARHWWRGTPGLPCRKSARHFFVLTPCTIDPPPPIV
jgi:hypothetical protein